MPVSDLIAGLLPVFVVIVVGAFLKRRVVTDDRQWQGLEKITFFVLIPCLIVETLARADFAQVPVGPIVGVLAAAIVTMVVLLSALYPLLVGKGRGGKPAYTSLFQTATRWNAMVALAVVASLYGDAAVAITALGMIVLIPIINVVNVTMLTWLLTEGRVHPLALLWRILTNPIIVGAIVGILVKLSPVPLWTPALNAVAVLGNAALGVILLSVGAGVRFGDVSRARRDIVLSLALKLVVLPALALGFGLSFGLHGFVLTTAVVIAAVPTASNGYILAREMGGDAPLYANAASLQVLVSFLTIPAWIAVTALAG